MDVAAQSPLDAAMRRMAHMFVRQMMRAEGFRVMIEDMEQAQRRSAENDRELDALVAMLYVPDAPAAAAPPPHTS